MNRIEEHILTAVATAKDSKVRGKIKNTIVPYVCSQATWYKYLSNERQPSLANASAILDVLKIWLPDLTLDDMIQTNQEEEVSPKIKLVKS